MDNAKGLEAVLGIAGGMDPKGFSSIVLAYIGDAIFEILVRTKVMSTGNAPVNRLHKRAREMVNAKAQSQMYFRIAHLLTEEEAGVFRRGRNAKSYTTPKNADLMDYRHATGLEAVFGYLYLQGNIERVMELFTQGIDEGKE